MCIQNKNECNTKNVCLKQANKCGGGVVFYSSFMKRLMFYYEKCVFKASDRLPFSLFSINQYCTHNVLLRKMWKA